MSEAAAPALTPVHLSNAVRTSAGPGPGVRWLPPEEAAWLVSQRLAVHC